MLKQYYMIFLKIQISINVIVNAIHDFRITG